MEIISGIVNYILFFSITAGIYAVLTLGLNIQWGYTGLFNIGIAGFYAIGAYVSTLLSGPPPAGLDPRIFGGFELPFAFGFIGAIVVSGGMAFLIGIPTLRLREDYLAIATIALAEVIRLIFKNEGWLSNSVWGIKHIPQPLHHLVTNVLGLNYNWFYLGLVIVLLGGIYLAVERVLRSPWGRVLRAVREDEEATAMAGKNVFSFKMQSLILGAMIMGAGGSLYAHYAKFISPDAFEPFFATFLIWVMLIIGGSGNNRGAIVGAFVIWGVWVGTEFVSDLLPAISAARAASIRVIIIGVLLQFILLLRPRGLLGEEKKVSKMLG